MTQILVVNGVDFSAYVSELTYEPQVLLSEDSGRNARGDNVVDIINRKDKITCQFIPMGQTAMASLLEAIEDYVFDVKFLHPRTNAMKTIRAYVGPAQVSLFRVYVARNAYRETSLSFIEM